MSYSEENGQVVLTMSREDFSKLLIYAGIATAQFVNKTPLLEWMNRLNQGNPNYTPYQGPQQ
jgi:hypothetical protein